MGISVLPAVNYQSPLNAIPIRVGTEPKEGRKIIPVEIDWGTMGGPNNTVSLNLQNNATLEFSQIIALSIDNSQCGGDIQFIFPDTSVTLTIPAYSPATIVEVFTNQTQFFVTNLGEQTEDITRFSILNFLPPPIAVPTTQEQNTVNSAGISSAVSGTTAIVAAGINGSIEGVHINWFTSVNASANWSLTDGTGKTLFTGEVAGGNYNNGTIGLAVDQFLNVLDIDDVRVRFTNGLNFNIVAGTAATIQFFNVAILYRTP